MSLSCVTIYVFLELLYVAFSLTYLFYYCLTICCFSPWLNMSFVLKNISSSSFFLFLFVCLFVSERPFLAGYLCFSCLTLTYVSFLPNYMCFSCPVFFWLYVSFLPDYILFSCLTICVSFVSLLLEYLCPSCVTVCVLLAKLQVSFLHDCLCNLAYLCLHWEYKWMKTSPLLVIAHLSSFSSLADKANLCPIYKRSICIRDLVSFKQT